MNHEDEVTYTEQAHLEQITVDLMLLQHATNNQIKATVDLQCSVMAARDVGVTWEKIGRTCGISKQAAQQRFHTSRL